MTNYEGKTQALLHWLEERPGFWLNPKAVVADLRSTGQGRGVVANQDIEEGEAVCTITLQSTMQCSLPPALRVQEPIASLETWDLLTLSLLYEFGLAEESKWWPYLQCLPPALDTLAFWSGAELAELQACAVVAQVGRVQANAHFMESIWPILMRFPGILGRNQHFLSDHQALLHACHHVASLILAYAFDIPPDSCSDSEDDEDCTAVKAMVPLADLFNSLGIASNARLVKAAAGLTMVTTSKIRAGSQIYNDYGDWPRSEVVRRYGFVDKSYQIWDVVDLSLASIERVVLAHTGMSEAEYKIRESCFRKYEESGTIELKKVHEAVVTPLAFASLLYIILADLPNAQAFSRRRGIPPLRDVRGGLSAARELGREIILHKLAGYTTSLEQDLELLMRPELSLRLRLAIEVRKSDKEILVSILKTLDHLAEW